MSTPDVSPHATADAASGAEMERIQGSMGLPPGFKLPGMG